MRSWGRFREPRDLDLAVLNRQRKVLGGDRPHTLITASGLAGGHRALGDFHETLEFEKRTYTLLQGAAPR
jgi:hypothetical protein